MKPLTAREHYHMRRLCEGVQCKTIAEETSTTPRVVSYTLHQAAAKLGAKTVYEACALYGKRAPE